MKNPPTFQEEAHCWIRRYEQLREQVLAGDRLIATDCRGLALLIRQGMAGWMRAWHDRSLVLLRPQRSEQKRRQRA